MATLTVTKSTGQWLFNETVTATPAFNGDRQNNYDSKFVREPAGISANQNDTLRLELRIFLRQVNPNAVTSPMMTVIARTKSLIAPGSGPVGMSPDYDKIPRWIRHWSDLEWSAFISSVKIQAALWNNKFWLIPPADFTHLDKTMIVPKGKGLALIVNETFRPTIKCEFSLMIVPSSVMAHASLDVVNILGSEMFRADNMTYSSTMSTPTPYEAVDWRSKLVKTLQPTIAHEIGHSLGLPHVGETRSLPNCRLAIDWKRLYHQDTLPLILKGGDASYVCYGELGTAGDINNIMGTGATFDAENAAPWLNRILVHLNLTQQDMLAAVGSLHKWKVSTTPTVPRKIA